MPPPLAAEAVAALADAAWQVRKGAAVGLSGAAGDAAVDGLLLAVGDPHPDVRRAAVTSLGAHAAVPAVRTALAGAARDTDADVRAYARLALD